MVRIIDNVDKKKAFTVKDLEPGQLARNKDVGYIIGTEQNKGPITVYGVILKDGRLIINETFEVEIYDRDLEVK